MTKRIDTYWNDFWFDSKSSKCQYFFSTTTKDKWITNFESHDMLSFLKCFMCPPINLFLSQFGTPWHFPCHSDWTCNEINNFIVMGCDGNLYLDVRRFSSFVDASNGAQAPIQNNQFNTGGMGYQPGQPSDIVVVRAYYRWKVMTPLFEPIFQNISGGERILVSTMMFRNEPF